MTISSPLCTYQAFWIDWKHERLRASRYETVDFSLSRIAQTRSLTFGPTPLCVMQQLFVSIVAVVTTGHHICNM